MIKVFNLAMFAALITGVYYDNEGLLELYSVYAFSLLVLISIAGAYCVYLAFEFDQESDKSFYLKDKLLTSFNGEIATYQKFIVIPVRVASLVLLALSQQYLVAAALFLSIVIFHRINKGMTRRFNQMSDYMASKSDSKVVIADFGKS
jgi:hypothetical protein